MDITSIAEVTRMHILAVDVGTTSLKMGIFQDQGERLECVREFSRSYPIHVYNQGLFADIEQEKWKEAFL